MPTELYYHEADTWKPFDTALPDILPDDNFILGTTKPHEGNTGLVSPTTITNNNADTTFSTNDEVIMDTLFNGNINVTGDNVSFYNCHFRGKMTATGNNIVRANDPVQAGAIFERCTFENRWFPDTDATDGGHGGIQCHDTTLIRCKFISATDGVGIISPGNVTMQGCYVDKHWFFSPDTDHKSDGTHCDSVQGHGGIISNVTIEGCTLVGLLDDSLPNSQAGIAPTYGTLGGTPGSLIGGNSWYDDFFSLWDGIYSFPPWGTSAILFGGTQVHTLNIINNWLDGGSYACINLNNQITDASSSAIVITGNRIGANTRDKTSGRSYLLIRSSSLSADLTVSGNIYESDGASADGAVRNG